MNANRERIIDGPTRDLISGLLQAVHTALGAPDRGFDYGKVATKVQEVLEILLKLPEVPEQGEAISPGPQMTIDQREPETLDDQADELLAQLRGLSLKFQKLGQAITQQDYSDGVNVGSEILGFVSNAERLAGKFNEIGLYDRKESFFL